MKFYEVLICELVPRGWVGGEASSLTWHLDQFLALRLRRRGGAGTRGRASAGVMSWFKNRSVEVSLTLLYHAFFRSPSLFLLLKGGGLGGTGIITFYF